MLKNVEPARFTRADANLDVLDRLLLRRFADKARRGVAKALPLASAAVRGLDIKLAELGAPILLRCGERPRPLHAGPDRPHPKNTHLRLGREQPSEHGARRDGGEGTRHHDGAPRQEG
jgi:hypothetical protein